MKNVSDEFNTGTVDGAKWRKDAYATNGYIWPGSPPKNWTPGWYFVPWNVHEWGGQLRIRAKRENYNGRPYTSGIVTSKYRIKYGYMEARMQGAPGTLNTAFWAADQVNGANNYWHELDVQEGRGDDTWWADRLRVHMHRWSDWRYNSQVHPGSSEQGIALGSNANLSSNFRTYGCWWEPNKVRFYYENGSTPKMTINHNWMNQPLRVILSLGVFSAKLPEQIGQQEWMEVDWVRMWMK